MFITWSSECTRTYYSRTQYNVPFAIKCIFMISMLLQFISFFISTIDIDRRYVPMILFFNIREADGGILCRPNALAYNLSRFHIHIVRT